MSKIQDELRGQADKTEQLADDVPCDENKFKVKKSAELLREVAKDIDDAEKSITDMLFGIDKSPF